MYFQCFSDSFAEWCKGELQFKLTLIHLNHCKYCSDEIATELASRTVEVRNHIFTGTWVVVDSRYDVFWVCYQSLCNILTLITISEQWQSLDAFCRRKWVPAHSCCASNRFVWNSSGAVHVAQRYTIPFQPPVMLQKPIQWASLSFTKKETILSNADADLCYILNEFEDVFKQELPARLPPERNVEHSIDILLWSKPL